jgi:hypothetical protein
MPRRPSTAHQPQPPVAAVAAPTEPLSEDQLARWADLIAAGRAEFPDGLAATQMAHLGSQVRERCRARLVHWIARTVALDLHRGGGPCSGD